ncbi:MAG: class I SAM-dependent methyltransferase [Leptolyngbyaceae cyanobacterium SU_3_3]|nr:class I SAM-dependent methyltransferase [Leptolyngbyaceae cyanobacterium SU_3_3]
MPNPNLQARTALPARFAHFPFNISQPLQKFALKLYSFLFKEQRAINLSLVEALRGALKMNRQLSEQVSALQMQSREMSRHLAVLDSQLSSLNSSLEETSDKTNAEEHSLDRFYAVFEDEYRGSREEILSRLKVYLPLIEAANIGSDDSAILDLGCGRGEWLELLQAAGWKAWGLDVNRIMVAQCRSRGLEVAEGDVIQYLESLPDRSLGAVTGFHIIEHLPFPILMKLFRETVRVLKPGGLAIFETPNPHNFFVSTHNFYLDPTHLKPLPASLMKFIAEQQGLTNVQIMELRPHPESAHIVEKYQAIGVELAEILGQHFYGAGDYGVIGYKG